MCIFVKCSQKGKLFHANLLTFDLELETSVDANSDTDRIEYSTVNKTLGTY